MSIIQEFKTFVLKGNVVDLAVGVLIGAAFGKVVESFTNGIIKPLLNAVGGNPDVSLTLWVFDLGTVITAVLSFLIAAVVIFFLVVKPMNTLFAFTMKKADEKPAEPSPIPEDVKLLMEIRDLLKNRTRTSAGGV
ncbi:MAG TPA: large conductance mechanosensitive channel protein MscL [Chthoniobacteraceae bacterium]|jgi:large conductance mechanosensitive channel|nr:large conductance mechanosensitive channel protein MscL [Chthoniobacteraceae bacterium]